MNYTPSFGRRSAGQISAPEPPVQPPPPPLETKLSGGGVPSAAIAELRAICLARLEPTAVAAMPPERLATDVERLISEIATERRIQLNGRGTRSGRSPRASACWVMSLS